MRTLALLVALGCFAGACGSHAPSPSPQPRPPALDPASPGPLRAGAGSRLIDLPVGHSHAGYSQSKWIGYPKTPADPGSPFADIFPATRALESPPMAKAVVLDNGRSRLALVKIDAVYVSHELYQRLLALAKEELGLSLDGQLILSATHTHSAGCRFAKHNLVPGILSKETERVQDVLAHGGDTFSQESTDRLARSALGALEDAVASLRPAKFGFGSAENLSASEDRRCQNDWLYGPDSIDRKVTVLRLDEAETGAPIAVLFHFAMHGTVYSGENRSLSTEVIGHAEYAVERLFDRPVVAIYLQGAAGDAAPAMPPSGHEGSQRMEWIGQDLARTVQQIYGEVAMEDELVLRSATEWFSFDHASLGYEEDEFFEDGSVLCHWGDTTCHEEPMDPARVVCVGIGEPEKTRKQTVLSVAQIGELALLTLPGEPVGAVGKALTELGRAQGFSDAIALGYAQSYDGYLLFEEDWLSAGYEPTISFWGWRYARVLVEESAALLEAMREGTTTRGTPPPLDWPAYEAVAPTRSQEAPRIELEPSEEAPRLSEVRFAFFGGDPALGTPEVTLEVEGEDGTFTEVQEQGWIPVRNLRGAQLPTFYAATPSYLEAPDATTRSHRWEIVYEPPIDLPEGNYRLHAQGRALGDAVASYALASRPFRVVPAVLALDLALTREIDAVQLAGTLRYPTARPRFSTELNDRGWQLANFRMAVARFGPPFVPVLAAEVLAKGTAASGDAAATELTLTFDAGGAEDVVGAYTPGEGPGVRATIPGAAAGVVTVSLPEGALVDTHGNRSAAATVTLEAP